MSKFTKPLTKAVLTHALNYEWSLQGLGMLRTYLAPDVRLHVWDSRHAFDDVSEMHTHPWNFVSHVIAGEVSQVRYIESDLGIPWQKQKIFCGIGGGLTGEPQEVKLQACYKETYGEGHVYQQNANEIHISSPLDGTVTIVERQFLEDADHAYVFFPVGESWVTAEPRMASPSEVLTITSYALHRWFS